MMRRILVLLLVAAMMALMLVAGALPVFAAASDDASCLGEAFSEAPPGTKGEGVSTIASGTQGHEPGFWGEEASRYAPQKEDCPGL
jgi:hypothetical protein